MSTRSIGPSMRRLSDRFGFAQAFEQRGAQQKLAGELRVLRGAPQLVVITLTHCRIALGQQPLVTDGLRLRVCQCDMTALALVAVEDVVIRLAARDRDQL